MRRDSGGFTLVELLLAVTLLSMLLALSYGGMRASTRASDRGQTILEESGKLRMAHQFVRKQLNQMVPLTFAEGEERGKDTVFEGSHNKIRFVAPMPGYLGFGGPQVQELSFRRGEEGLSLVLTHALLQGFEEERLSDRAPIVLLENIDRGTFEFQGRRKDEELAPWVQSWDEPWTIPAAVSLEIEFNKDVFVDWPLMTANVRIDAGAISEMKNAGEPSAYSTTIQELINKRKNQN